MTEIGTATGTGDMPISFIIGSLFLTTASGSDWMPDSTRGITCHITPATTIRTITTLTFSRTITPRPLMIIRTVTTLPFSRTIIPRPRTITPGPLMMRRWLIPRSKRSKQSSPNSVITTVQSMGFGPTTRDAVTKYQIDKQLDVTGSLSPDTLQSLGVPPG